MENQWNIIPPSLPSTDYELLLSTRNCCKGFTLYSVWNVNTSLSGSMGKNVRLRLHCFFMKLLGVGLLSLCFMHQFGISSVMLVRMLCKCVCYCCRCLLYIVWLTPWVMKFRNANNLKNCWHRVACLHRLSFRLCVLPLQVVMALQGRVMRLLTPPHMLHHRELPIPRADRLASCSSNNVSWI